MATLTEKILELEELNQTRNAFQAEDVARQRSEGAVVVYHRSKLWPSEQDKERVEVLFEEISKELWLLVSPKLSDLRRVFSSEVKKGFRALNEAKIGLDPDWCHSNSEFMSLLEWLTPGGQHMVSRLRANMAVRAAAK